MAIPHLLQTIFLYLLQLPYRYQGEDVGDGILALPQKEILQSWSLHVQSTQHQDNGIELLFPFIFCWHLSDVRISAQVFFDVYASYLNSTIL
jgi:hypothetical protein